MSILFSKKSIIFENFFHLFSFSFHFSKTNAILTRQTPHKSPFDRLFTKNLQSK